MHGPGSRQRATLRMSMLLALAAISSTALAAAPPFDFKHPGDLGYKEARAKLIRAGYRPLRLRHDKDDQCTGGFCTWYPEALTCGGSMYWCAFIFERPHAQKLPLKQRYLVVKTSGEPFFERQALVLYAKPANNEELTWLWMRKDLKHRGCKKAGLSFRFCDTAQ